ncbi:MAG: type II toxin-antitoxin system ParD family antitoxin [Caulobacterales bacterium]|nr:type II toxin-antitoxin system ParD family antitoxin [Caulobacterales bacterium]
MTTNVSLTPQLEAYIQSRIQAGDYATTSEFVREAVREKRERDYRIDELRALIMEGINSGPGVPMEQTFAELHARLETKYGYKAERA